MINAVEQMGEDLRHEKISDSKRERGREHETVAAREPRVSEHADARDSDRGEEERGHAS